MRGAVLLLQLLAPGGTDLEPQVAIELNLIPPRTIVANMWGTRGVTSLTAVALPQLGPCTVTRFPGGENGWAWSAQINCEQALVGDDDRRGIFIEAGSWWNQLANAGARRASLSVVRPNNMTLLCPGMGAGCAVSWSATDCDRQNVVLLVSPPRWQAALAFGGSWGVLVLLACLLFWTRHRFTRLPLGAMQATWPRLMQLWGGTLLLAPLAVMATPFFTDLLGTIQWHGNTAASPLAAYAVMASLPTLGAGLLGLALLGPARLVWGADSNKLHGRCII